MLTGIDKSDYSKIESGKRNLSFEQYRQLAVALETSMDIWPAAPMSRLPIRLPAESNPQPLPSRFLTR